MAEEESQAPPSSEKMSDNPFEQPGGPRIEFRGPPGGPQPTQEQIREMQRKLIEDARNAGMTVQQYLHRLQAQMQQQQQQQQQQGEGQPAGGSRPGLPPGAPPNARPVQPGPPKPEALALATFLRSQNLKPRTVIFNGDRKEMFRVKRALRAIKSPEYEKARAKNPLLPEITDRASLENAFKLLPLSMLALRVSQIEPARKSPKRIKGQWTVRVEPQQDAEDDMYYMWLWEGSQVMKKVYAGLALLVIFILVLYPLWPLFLRQGVYYLSWGCLGLLGLFLLMAVFRVILFCITYFVVPPGLWLYPNLWEDVGFFDSFRPVWAWHGETKGKKKKKSKAVGAGANEAFSNATGQPAPANATTTATSTQIQTQPSGASAPIQRQNSYMAPQVEEE